MKESQNKSINYEEIFISVIEYIRDNPNCNIDVCNKYTIDKFELYGQNESIIFINQTISKVSILGNSSINRIIHPDALFYLMEYRELKHSLEESRAARKQATLSTWFAVIGIGISIIGLFLTIYFSNKEINKTEPNYTNLINETNSKLDSLININKSK